MKGNFFILSFACLFLVLALALAEEGMWPISEIARLDMQSKGLRIQPKDICHSDGAGLMNAIVKIGGCTGSFISSEGLILTNHHCAYSAIQAASTKEKNHLENGFVARERVHEIPAPGYTLRITEAYRDVSREVLGAVEGEDDILEKVRRIEKTVKEIIASEETKNPGKRAEVAEMFRGKSYMLFLYTYLKDVRLVYAPPRAIGEFGGETDNWIWPRHTGDFAIMRAYVSPDGSPAEYSSSNVPYRPRKHLRIAPQGVEEGDAVFLLGYPGRTFRHQTSHFLAHEQNVNMPYIANLYEWQISILQRRGEENQALALKHSPRIKSLSNVMKNYRGKLAGLKRLDLVNRKKEEEKALHRFISSDPDLHKTYGNLLASLEEGYREIDRWSRQEMVLTHLLRSCVLLQGACKIYEASIERSKKDMEREAEYMDRNFAQTRERILSSLKNYDEEIDKTFLREMLLRASRLPQEMQLPAVQKRIDPARAEESIATFISHAYEKSRLKDSAFMHDALGKGLQAILSLEDPLIEFSAELYPTIQEMSRRNKERKGKLDKFYVQLSDVKARFLGTSFLPDANGTLRFTCGTVRGYSPKDAVYCTPITTVEGILEKNTGLDPFDAPRSLIELCREKEFGKFSHPKLNSVPVALLYDADTTGGNSGSPVLNARGEIVGVNFDRAWEATINDYAWSSSYSRSIGVDVRYLLWLLQKMERADHLLEEMGIER